MVRNRRWSSRRPCRCAADILDLLPMRNPPFQVLPDASVVNPPDGFLRDVLSGLARGQKAIPPRWFYDQEGSRLFEDITRLPQYYLTRCERRILSTYIGEIAPHLGH